MTGAAALPGIAVLAEREFERRREAARRKVGDCSLAPGQAEALLRPWAALACRAGANLAELAPLLDQYRAIVRIDGSPFFADGEIRALVADEICPRRDAVAALAAARSHALERAHLSPTRLERARALAALAGHFHAPAAKVAA